jgi:sRNA-binding carbon storage regulator CsrA
MADHAVSECGHIGFPHRVLDRLTAMKLRIGSLRRRVRLGTIAPEEIETHLAQIDQEIDATATLAQDVQAQGSSSA